MRRVFILLAVLAVAATACSSGSGTTETAGGASTQPASEAPPASPVGSGCADFSTQDTFTVTIKDFAFDPSCFTAKGSASITVVNDDTADHTFTIEGTQVDVTIPAGQTFNGESAGLKPGDYDFRCTIHPSMTGTVTVV